MVRKMYLKREREKKINSSIKLKRILKVRIEIKIKNQIKTKVCKRNE